MSERDKEIYKMFFKKHSTLTEIRKRFNMSHQAITKVLNLMIANEIPKQFHPKPEVATKKESYKDLIIIQEDVDEKIKYLIGY